MCVLTLLTLFLLAALSSASAEELTALPATEPCTGASCHTASAQWPLLMTHESSSYYCSEDCQDQVRREVPQDVLVKFLSDQTVNVTESLELGVRAFDFRPQWIQSSNQTILHHSMAEIRVNLDGLLQEIKTWFDGLGQPQNQSAYELVVVVIQVDQKTRVTHVTADQVTALQNTFDLATRHGFKVYNDDSRVSGYDTCDSFTNAIRQPIHGVTVISGCDVPGNYDEDISCTHQKSSTYESWPITMPEPVCSDAQLRRLQNYIEGFASESQNQGSRLAVMQAHEQGMQVVHVEENFHVNQMVATTLHNIAPQLVRRPYMIQIDHVAHDGDLVLAEIQKIQQMGGATCGSDVDCTGLKAKAQSPMLRGR